MHQTIDKLMNELDALKNLDSDHKIFQIDRIDQIQNELLEIYVNNDDQVLSTKRADLIEEKIVASYVMPIAPIVMPIGWARRAHVRTLANIFADNKAEFAKKAVLLGTAVKDESKKGCYTLSTAGRAVLKYVGVGAKKAPAP